MMKLFVFCITLKYAFHSFDGLNHVEHFWIVPNENDHGFYSWSLKSKIDSSKHKAIQVNNFF